MVYEHKGYKTCKSRKDFESSVKKTTSMVELSHSLCMIHLENASAVHDCVNHHFE